MGRTETGDGPLLTIMTYSVARVEISGQMARYRVVNRYRLIHGWLAGRRRRET